MKSGCRFVVLRKALRLGLVGARETLLDDDARNLDFGEQGAEQRRYDDKVSAVQVLKAAPLDWQRLRRSGSFARFEQRLLAC